MPYGFSFLPSSVAACYLCCHLHRWTRLRGTYPMISSISGPINSISNVLSLHMTVCLKTSLSHRHLGHADSVWVQMICAVYVVQSSAIISRRVLKWGRMHHALFSVSASPTKWCVSAFTVGGTYAIWRGGSLLLLNWHYKKYLFVGFCKSLHITITQMQVPHIATVFLV